MPRSEIVSRLDQVVAHMRRGMAEGRWHEVLPGRRRLAAELGCSHGTVDEAINMLIKQGLLLSQGKGQPRRINLAADLERVSPLRVQILLYEKSDAKLGVIVELRHLLQRAGHETFYAGKTLLELRMDAGRVARFVQASQADAWVVLGGSREVLEWFARQATPAFALFGRSVSVPLASTSPKKARAEAEALDRMVALGHRRIVRLVRRERRKPNPGLLERLFLERLAQHGIPTGDYNLPDWEESPAGLQALLDSLFKFTPPTAMIIGGPALFHAVRSYLGNRCILVPDHVSLLCTDSDPSFEWCLPQVAHLTWDSAPIVRRVVKWADQTSRGKQDLRKTTTLARLVMGGTLGPVPAKR